MIFLHFIINSIFFSNDNNIKFNYICKVINKNIFKCPMVEETIGLTTTLFNSTQIDFTEKTIN